MPYICSHKLEQREGGGNWERKERKKKEKKKKGKKKGALAMALAMALALALIGIGTNASLIRPSAPPPYRSCVQLLHGGVNRLARSEWHSRCPDQVTMYCTFKNYFAEVSCVFFCFA